MKYPLKTMSIGESFTVPFEEAPKRLGIYLQRRGNDLERSFIFRRGVDGFDIIREA